MAFSGEYVQRQRWGIFSFYATGSGALSETIVPGKIFSVNEIRLTLSAAFASVRDFIIAVSTASGAQYNHKLLSKAMLGSLDVLYIPAASFVLASDDRINLSMFQSSANIWGLQVIGWAVLGG